MLVFLKNAETKPLLQPLKLNLIRGRLPRPGSRETVLHWRIAANRGLKIGDSFKVQYSDDGLLDTHYRLTGLLDGKLLLGLADLDCFMQEYQLSEEQTGLMLVPQPGHLAQLNRYLERQSQKGNQLSTTKGLENFTLSYINDLFLMINTVHLIITGILALCAGFLFYLYFYQRRTEFGLLEALGHTRSRIVGRVFMEILVLNLLGFGSAVGAAFIGGWVLNRFILPAQGLALVLWEPDFLLKLLSTPLVVTCCSLTPVWRMLKQLEPISIIERTSNRAAVKTGKPLSNWQYFCNNYRRVGVVLMVVLVSIILQGALLIYTITMLRLEERCELEPWSAITYTGYVKPAQGQVGRLRKTLGQHPSIAKVLPYLHSVTKMKGVGITTPSILYIGANEIGQAMDGLNLKLVKGRLPSSSNYEIIMHWQLAASLGIKINARTENSKFRLVGLFDGKPILGLASYDRLVADHRIVKDNLRLLVIAKKGQISSVKRYLLQLQQKDQKLITSAHTEKSYREDIAEFRMIINVITATLTGIVSLCAIFLLYLYFYHRRPELGMLEALGQTRSMIIKRAFLEVLVINLLGLFLGATVVFLGGWVLNRIVLVKHGLPMVLWDPEYLYKLLPIPLLITFWSIVPVWRLITKVDPIAMIEGEN